MIAQSLQTIIADRAVTASVLVIFLLGVFTGLGIKNVVDSFIFDKNVFKSLTIGDSEDCESRERITDGGRVMRKDNDDLANRGGLASDTPGRRAEEIAGSNTTGGSSTDELEDRLDELNEELASLSTVRSENKQIRASVQDVKEGLRKLPDELETDGIDQITADIEAEIEDDDRDDASSSGVVDQDTDIQELGEAGDEAMDAETFFDEVLVQKAGKEPSPSNGQIDTVFPDGSTDTDVTDSSFDDGRSDGGDLNGDSTKSFQDRKAKYRFNDAEWKIEDSPEGGTDNSEQTVDEPLDSTANPKKKPFPTTHESDGVQDIPDEGNARAQPDLEPISTAPNTTGAAITSPSSGNRTEKPYLTALPSDPTGITLVKEWLEYLLQHAQYREAMRAIEYYESVSWINEDVADELQRMLCSFDTIDGGNGKLTIDNHKQSLQYISRLDTDSGAEAVLLSKLVGRDDTDRDSSR